jgi:putative PIN family toxin of toxin-antitoxin system
MRIVVDTSVIVAGLRSPSGASAEVLRLILAGNLEAAVTTALLLEYEAVVTRPEHLLVAGLSTSEAVLVIDALTAAMHEVSIRWRMRPASPDPADDLVIEAAVNASADILVTFNRRDLDAACSSAGIRTAAPAVLLSELGSS